MWFRRVGLWAVVSFVACDDGFQATDGPALGRADTFHPADGPGAYNVGAMTFSAVMTGGRITRVQVFYPTAEPADCDGGYTVLTPVQFGTLWVPSPLCAVAEAAVAPGEWPLIVYDHGGGGAGADYQRVYQAPLHEHLASHGFVVVTAPHSANTIARAEDIRRMIDLFEERAAEPTDAFFEHIDLDRIGVSGFSAGGTSSFNLAAGNTALGIEADPRIRAAVFYEPGQPELSYADAATMTVPYMIHGGSQFVSGVLAPDLFAATTEARPRVYVHTPGALHVNNSTGLCDLIEAAREEALLGDPEIPEPLTTLLSGNPEAALAYNLWNTDSTLYLIGVGFGGGRNVCDQVGLGPARSLDVAPEDGLTDSPPFMSPSPPYTLALAPSAQETGPSVIFYGVAFWQAFLADDARYRRYFAPGYAIAHDLPTVVHREY